jgi:isopenicillin N synthase-like dioxygenase
MADLPIINLGLYLTPDTPAAELQAECDKVAQCLASYGILIVKDPRVSEAENEAFLDMLEQYYAQPYEAKLPDVHPEFHHQVGATTGGTEVPRDHSKKIAELDEDNKPHPPKGADPKWRFFWRIGNKYPENTKFPALNAPPVIPAAFADVWATQMNRWGEFLLAAGTSIVQMAALGFGLEKETFSQMMTYGPHLLAPTGSDLASNHEIDTVFAGFHYDLNLLTVHGKSRYPGLFAWTREGKRFAVKVPTGCLIMQAGKQFEWVTGGQVLAGFHEVVVSNATIDTYNTRAAAGKILWRVSSTEFLHIGSDVVLEPVGRFATHEAQAKYPPTLAGDQVQAELKSIALAAM